jgi:hypothetical protein
MNIVGIIWEDFVNYKKISTTIMMPYCSFKCDKEYGTQICQNCNLEKETKTDYNDALIINHYLDTDISRAIVFQGLEPFDSWEELSKFIQEFRSVCDDDIVIYTGYNKDEVSDYIEELKKYKDIIIKFGRYIPNEVRHFDTVLGVYLASSNQYAEKIS